MDACPWAGVGRDAVAIVAKRLLADGRQINGPHEPTTAGNHTFPAGTVNVPAGARTVEKLSQWARELGVDVHGSPGRTARPEVDALAHGRPPSLHAAGIRGVA